MKRPFQISFLSAILLTAFFSMTPASASPYHAGSIEMISHELNYLFSEQLEIKAQFPANIEIKQVQLVFKTIDSTVSSNVFDLELQPENRVIFNYDFDRWQNYPAYSTLQYLFVVTTQTGQQLETATETFTYTDNRFKWQTLNSDNRFVIHWYSGDLAFGQSILDAAQNSLGYADQFIALPAPERLDIFVYASSLEVRKALNIPINVPIAGHASPANNLILVSIQPGVEQTIEIERQVPHEISHIRLYLLTGSSYEKLPNWLREGLASLSELYPNPDFNGALDIAAEQGELLPIELLCNPFPTDARYAFLAYAQSQSMVNYIYETYGSNGLKSVIQAYAAGESCENGTKAATEQALSRLERSWQIWRYSAPQTTVTENQFPLSAWLLLFILSLSWPILNIFIRKK